MAAYESFDRGQALIPSSEEAESQAQLKSIDELNGVDWHLGEEFRSRNQCIVLSGSEQEILTLLAERHHFSNPSELVSVVN